jgi:phage terminase small subunit
MNRKLYFMLLKAKQEAFAQAYAEDPNGAAAARAAGYAEGSARQEANRLLAQPEVAQRIEELQLAAAERRAKKTEELMARLETILEAEIAAGERSEARKTIRLQAQLARLIGAR